MTGESHYEITIAALGDWLAPVFPTNEKQNQSQNYCTLYARFFPRFEQVTGYC